LLLSNLIERQSPAQQIIQPPAQQIIQQRNDIILLQDVSPDSPEVVNTSATLKTDPDLESILERAERHRADGNYRVATHFWQTVLERSGDALYSTDGTIYFSLVQQVEKTLAELPPEGLQIYRITADANAKEILAQAADPYDPQSLSDVVRLYFLSSLGDDAAFQLASIYWTALILSARGAC
jgi:hypothetical protein